MLGWRTSLIFKLSVHLSSFVGQVRELTRTVHASIYLYVQVQYTQSRFTERDKIYTEFNETLPGSTQSLLTVLSVRVYRRNYNSTMNVRRTRTVGDESFIHSDK